MASSFYVDFRKLDDFPSHLKKLDYWVYLEKLSGGIAGYSEKDSRIAARCSLTERGLFMRRLSEDLGPWYQHSPRFELVPGFRPDWKKPITVEYHVWLSEKTNNNEIIQIMNRRHFKGSTPIFQIEINQGVIMARYSPKGGGLIREYVATLSDHLHRKTEFTIKAKQGSPMGAGYYQLFIDGVLKFQTFDVPNYGESDKFQFQYGLYSAPLRTKKGTPAEITIERLSISIDSAEDEEVEKEAPKIDYANLGREFEKLYLKFIPPYTSK